MYKDSTILSMTRDQLQSGNIPVDIFPDAESVFRHLATEMVNTIQTNNEAGKDTLMIVPLGPVGQYPFLVECINRNHISLKRTTFINMDEYMEDQDRLIDAGDPLSFRNAMHRHLYSLVDSELLMDEDRRLFPLPDTFIHIETVIRHHGGVDLCVGGVGINGHVAFNEANAAPDAQAFMELPSRVVPIAPETIVVNGLNEYEGAYEFMPRWASTLGFREIAASRRILLGCFRPWHKMVVRKAVCYPPSPQFPVTLLAQPGTRLCIPEAIV